LSGEEIAMVRKGPPQPTPYPAEKARGGTIILRRPWQRAVFIGGLAGVFVLILVLLVLRLS
jgi:hypothetical protein